MLVLIIVLVHIMVLHAIMQSDSGKIFVCRHGVCARGRGKSLRTGTACLDFKFKLASGLM